MPCLDPIMIDLYGPAIPLEERIYHWIKSSSIRVNCLSLPEPVRDASSWNRKLKGDGRSKMNIVLGKMCSDWLGKLEHGDVV